MTSRIFLIFVLSLSVSSLDHNNSYLDPFRNLLFDAVTPVYFLAELPTRIFNQFDELFVSRVRLARALEDQQKRNLHLSRIQQKYEFLQQENTRMRKLLGSSSSRDEEVQIAEIVSVNLSRGSMNMVINKGLSDGVQFGDVVIDDAGVVGQISRAGSQTSLVLLITDKDHATPIQVRRNGLRAVAGGTGSLEYLALENLPLSIDLRVGDIVETSGLAGRFPYGYAVGEVVDIQKEQTAVFASVKVAPTAKLSQSRYLLVLNDRQQNIEIGQKKL